MIYTEEDIYTAWKNCQNESSIYDGPFNINHFLFQLKKLKGVVARPWMIIKNIHTSEIGVVTIWGKNTPISGTLPYYPVSRNYGAMLTSCNNLAPCWCKQYNNFYTIDGYPIIGYSEK